MICRLHSRPKMCALCVGVCLLVHLHCCHSDTPSPTTPSHDALTSKAYLQEIFAKYGNGNVLTFNGFERLLHKLGLGSNGDVTGADHTKAEAVRVLNCTRNTRSVTRLAEAETRTGNGRAQEHGIHKRAATTAVEEKIFNKCLLAKGVLDVYKMKRSEVIQPEQFLHLCPALVQQLESGACHQSAKHDDDDKDQAYVRKGMFHHIISIPGKVWGFSLLSVTVISLVGLLCVAIVPLTRKVYFNHVIQFLVSVAVGSLTGDALLHLLPHSMIKSDDGGHNHSHDKSAVWSGLMAFAGVYIFFLTERMIALFAEWRRNKRAKMLQHVKRFQVEGEGYPSMMSELGAKLTTDHSVSCDDMMTVVHPSRDVKKMADDAHDEMHASCDVSIRDTWGHSHVAGHSHTAGHSHEAARSVSSVALMVVMGDGLHNFCDGLAIGAAFCHSLTGGLSTSVAIFCHELPHELGDFAVLLRVGMTVRQALIYNCLSSVLCLLGMLVGIAVGNIDSASTWIFALAAGMFLYIALVDMVPEMTSISPKAGETPFLHFGLQNVGILTGASVMLVIALYEDEFNL